MASLTTGIASKADAQARLQMWLDAEQAVAQHGQAYGIGDRTLTRADLREIRRQVAYWQREVSAWAAKAAGAGGPSHKVATWTG